MHSSDLYFHADDLRDRLPKYAAYRAEKEEQEMDEMKQYFEAQEND